MPNSSAPQTTPKGERAEALPSNLRRLRLEAQLTLDRLGALSGVSRAMISKIERGASVPTATVLGKLAAALQVSLSQLLGGFHARQPRLHGRERQAVYHDPASGFERRSLSPLFEDGAVDLAFNVLPPGKSVEFPPHHAGVEEFLVVHEGALAVVIDGSRFDVAAGDTLFFPSDCVHEFRNEGGEPAVFYIVINDRTRR
ncbi:TPA: helix-turn-helix transcriptional regulator [Pseudomonas aeruginosa]|nr:helix-turn-helix transcriptional regulator [Pseudomonas aeruginosa]